MPLDGSLFDSMLYFGKPDVERMLHVIHRADVVIYNTLEGFKDSVDRFRVDKVLHQPPNCTWPADLATYDRLLDLCDREEFYMGLHSKCKFYTERLRAISRKTYILRKDQRFLRRTHAILRRHRIALGLV